MPMYNLIEYSDNYSKTSGRLWQYYKDDPNITITQSESFKFKIKIAVQSSVTGNTKHLEISVPLKYLTNFCRTLEMPLIIAKSILFWHDDEPASTEEAKFKITETKLYAPVVSLSPQDNAKLLQQLKSGFKRTINWNKYESNIKRFPKIDT